MNDREQNPSGGDTVLQQFLKRKYGVDAVSEPIAVAAPEAEHDGSHAEAWRRLEVVYYYRWKSVPRSTRVLAALRRALAPKLAGQDAHAGLAAGEYSA